MQEVEAIRCMQLPLLDDWLVLPNEAVAEVIAFIEPTVIDREIQGCSGVVTWRGVNVPLLSYENLCGLAEPERSARDRIAIIYHPEGLKLKSYIAIKLTDIPKAYRAQAENFHTETVDLKNDRFVKYQLSLDEKRMFIPDIEALFDLI